MRPLVLLLLVTVAFASCKKDSGSPGSSTPVTPTDTIPPPPPSTGALADNDHMLFGNPGNAAAITDSFNNYLMRKDYYATSYSRTRGIPNWVSWHLNTSSIGTTNRQDNFRPDDKLPAGWYRVHENSYSSSGFDRGHNCPSGDRTSSLAANSATFLMTNMIPQAPKQNQGVWNSFEEYLRSEVKKGQEVYIIMGNYGKGGTGSKGFTSTIDNGKVTVPAFTYRLALFLPNGNNDTARITTSSRVIAINIPNNNSVGTNWRSYRVSVDALEAITGLDFFSRIVDEVEPILEAKVDDL